MSGWRVAVFSIIFFTSYTQDCKMFAHINERLGFRRQNHHQALQSPNLNAEGRRGVLGLPRRVKNDVLKGLEVAWGAALGHGPAAASAPVLAPHLDLVLPLGQQLGDKARKVCGGDSDRGKLVVAADALDHRHGVEALLGNIGRVGAVAAVVDPAVAFPKEEPDCLRLRLEALEEAAEAIGLLPVCSGGY